MAAGELDERGAHRLVGEMHAEERHDGSRRAAAAVRVGPAPPTVVGDVVEQRAHHPALGDSALAHRPLQIGMSRALLVLLDAARAVRVALEHEDIALVLEVHGGGIGRGFRLALPGVAGPLVPDVDPAVHGHVLGSDLELDDGGGGRVGHGRSPGTIWEGREGSMERTGRSRVGATREPPDGTRSRIRVRLAGNDSRTYREGR